jgi:hypothetical protein
MCKPALLSEIIERAIKNFTIKTVGNIQCVIGAAAIYNYYFIGEPVAPCQNIGQVLRAVAGKYVNRQVLHTQH